MRIIEPICDAMGIEHLLVSEEADVAKIAPGDREGLQALAPRRDPDRPEARHIMMKRDEAFKILARHIDDQIVVAT